MFPLLIYFKIVDLILPMYVLYLEIPINSHIEILLIISSQK